MAETEFDTIDDLPDPIDPTTAPRPESSSERDANDFSTARIDRNAPAGDDADEPDAGELGEEEDLDGEGGVEDDDEDEDA